MLTLERATEDDVPAVVRLMNRAYRGTGLDAGWNSEAAFMEGDRTSDASLRAEMAASSSARLLVWRGDEIAPLGCVWLEAMHGHVWYLGSLTIDPKAQSRGLGSELLRAAESWVEAQGGRTIRITVVNVRETLVAWYERRGYVQTGKTEPYPYEDCRFGIATRSDLCFLVLEKELAPGLSTTADTRNP